MQGQIKAVTQRETAQAYLAGLETQASSESSTFLDAPQQLADADAAHRAATAQNEADWAHDNGQHAINQHYIDVQFGQQNQAIADAKAKLDDAVSTWIATPRPDGRPQTDLPPPALWVRLSPDEQQAVLAALIVSTTECVTTIQTILLLEQLLVPTLRFCRPDGVTGNDAVELVVRDLGNPPKFGDKPFFIVVIATFQKHWPCR
jgi:hypothetical protein